MVSKQPEIRMEAVVKFADLMDNLWILEGARV